MQRPRFKYLLYHYGTPSTVLDSTCISIHFPLALKVNSSEVESLEVHVMGEGASSLKSSVTVPEETMVLFLPGVGKWM